MHYENFILQPEGVRGSDLARIARRFSNVAYSMRHSYVERLEDGSYSGQMDCLRFVLYVLREAGFLAQDFEVEQLVRPRPKETLEVALRHLLESNTDRVPDSAPRKGTNWQLGDILLMNYTDLATGAARAHHIGLVTWLYPQPSAFIGKFMHAENYDVNGGGRVYEQEISRHVLVNRIDSVWRVRGLEPEAENPDNEAAGEMLV